MGFLKSAINQVGRDMGRVVSNAVFKDRHSIPIRRAASRGGSATQRPSNSKAVPIKKVQSDFDKAISFKTGYRPTTLISKLGGAFVVIKNEAQAFVEDGYLDIEESQQLMEMMRRFTDKCSDVEDVISFTESDDSKVYKQLEKIHIATQEVFVDVLEISAKACENRAKAYEDASQEAPPRISYSRYVFLHLIWMPNYAKGGKKQTGVAIFMNILDVFLSITLLPGIILVSRFILLIMGLTSYSSHINSSKKEIETFQKLAQQERDRAKAYWEYIKINKVS